ncbi:serine/threonine-protein kinase [Dolichospermum flos-aquae]|uniref:non-specific serine/threonine protein kinase n=1 Tax=Dolichospermum flos-aquae CCAP 1403/13F TaxID=315271 RepID=A0A6H2BX67_DOLFA|nr:serine/threonine-protein kinase [Dolichospermum flos-aquae]QJB43309.1 serine/threonine protein kinase [Dolichospermum flos-aquae CCAP 1403/13F]
MTNQMIGQVLQDRYQIVQPLSAGVFAQTFIAVDMYHPEKPRYVVKQLKVNHYQSTSYFDHLRLRFLTETETLKHLGRHPQIPELITYFEENERFYLVQQFIPGESLAAELPHDPESHGKWSQVDIIKFLEDALSILEFIHSQGFIHCDIKPENLIRRAIDARLVLIDFGSIQPVDSSIDTEFSIDQIPVTSLGYIPPEQFIGQTQPNSDLYSLGIIAIQAITGLSPLELEIDAETNEIIWCDHDTSINDYLVAFLNQMIRYQHQERFQSANEALWLLKHIEWDNNPAEIQIAESQLSDKTIETTDQKSQPLLAGLRLGLLINSVLLGLGVYSLFNNSQAYSATEILYKAIARYQSGDLQKAINLARSIPLNSNVYPEAQASIEEWQNQWQKDAKHYVLTEKALKERRWTDVLYHAHKVPINSYWKSKIQPLVAQAKLNIEAQTQSLLAKAYAKAEERDFSTALYYLQQIPEESSAGAMVKQKLAEYNQKRQVRSGYYLYQAHNQASIGNFFAAIKLLERVPKDAEVYAQARVKLEEYSHKLRLRNQQQELAILKTVPLAERQNTPIQRRVSLQPEDYLQEVNIRN